jgi:AcrR family transcriptional regulator
MPIGQRREQLLDAALAIIVRDGYRAVSIDAIAREADVTRPVVYNAFDGLGRLLQALLDRQEARALAQLLDTVAAPPPHDATGRAAFVRETIVRLVAMVAENPATWTPILLATVDTPPVVSERIERDRELVRGRFQSLVELMFGAELPAAVDTGIVAHALLALAEHFGRLILADPAGVDAERLADTVTALLIPSGRVRPASAGG